MNKRDGGFPTTPPHCGPLPIFYFGGRDMGGLLQCVEEVEYLAEHLLFAAFPSECVAHTFSLKPLGKWFCLAMIHSKTLLDGLFVVVGTSLFLGAVEESCHQCLFVDNQFYHDAHAVMAVGEHLLEGFGLSYCAWESVEYDT